MREDFLHFIWQFQYFDQQQLQTTDRQSISVLYPGAKNTDAGPDFKQARVLINDVEWTGSVEIHLKSSFWDIHQHQHDRAYNNVVLHVVWQDDRPVRRADQSSIPTLELKGRVNLDWLYRYQSLIQNQAPIPCANLLAQVNPLKKMMMLDRVLVERLEKKAFLIRALLVSNQQDWEETTYQLLAKNFGFKVNSEVFLRLSQGLPLKIIRKHQDHPEQIEALLFGQAGFLEAITQSEADDYTRRLCREYTFLSKKYQLADQRLEVTQWKFLRLRPANFPTVRISQLATLLSQEQNLFSLLCHSKADLPLKRLAVKPSAYWQQHYHFHKPARKTVPGLGKSSIENILINTVAPLMASYALEKDQSAYMDKAIALLENLKAENNRIIKMWKELDMTVQHAQDTQALIELYQSYCQAKKCLQCSIGLNLVQC